MGSRSYSRDIADAIDTYLKENDWNFSFDDDRGVFKFGLSLKCKIKNVQYFIYVNDSEYTVYAVSPLGASQDDKEMMYAMSEFVCRANYGLKNGCFELDFNDGEIRYKSYVDCEKQIPSDGVIEDSIHCPAAMFKRYSEGIVRIIFGEKDAKELVELCESDRKPTPPPADDDSSSDSGSATSSSPDVTDIVGEDFDGDIDSMIEILRGKLGLGGDDSKD